MGETCSGMYGTGRVNQTTGIYGLGKRVKSEMLNNRVLGTEYLGHTWGMVRGIYESQLISIGWIYSKYTY
jgi:hypothetical protein